MRRLIGSITLVLLLMATFPPPSSAAVPAGALTVGIARQALIDAIGRLDTVLTNTTGNIKAIGNSLEANARGVVSDIDTRLGNKLDYTFDRLDKTERQLMEDAQALVGQVESSARAIVELTAAAATRVLGDADIIAYNALYSLPCRSQVPRIVYLTPEVLHEAYTVPEIALRGNFLDLGPEPKVTVDGKQAAVLGRSANAMRLSLPSTVVTGVKRSHSVSIRFRPTQVEKSCYLWGLIPWSTEKPLSRDLTASALLHPKTTTRIKATVTPVVTRHETMSVPYELDDGTGNDCDRHFDATRTFCLPDAWGGRLVPAGAYSGPGIHSQNCDSGVQSVSLAGDRCIKVEAKIGGCGYNVNFLGIKDCKGRGWLHYSGKLNGERDVPIDGAPGDISADGVIPVRTNFLLPYKGNLDGQTPSKWRYSARVDFFRGDPQQPIRTLEISDIDPTVGGIVSRMDNATLAVDLSQVVPGLFAPQQ